MGLTTSIAGLAVRAPDGKVPGATASLLARSAVFQRILTRIHRYFSKMVRDPSEAEECVQRTLVELDRSLRDRIYNPARSFNAWMWLKARTVWAGWCRERERGMRLLTMEEQAVARGGGVAEVERRLDAEAVLEEVRRRLGDEAHDAFVLYYGGELTLEEVAEGLERDRKTVARRLAAAHVLIDRLLGK